MISVYIDKPHHQAKIEPVSHVADYSESAGAGHRRRALPASRPREVTAGRFAESPGELVRGSVRSIPKSCRALPQANPDHLAVSQSLAQQQLMLQQADSARSVTAEELQAGARPSTTSR